jgi:hypothetical protein
MEYMFSFVTGYCCHLQSGTLPSLWDGSSISATAGNATGTDILKLCGTVSDCSGISDILETTPFKLQFHCQKHKEIMMGQMR